jgi:hypothetical protein
LNGHAPDGFEALLGNRRGLTDPTAMLERLDLQEAVLRDLREALVDARSDVQVKEEALLDAEGALQRKRFEAIKLRGHLDDVNTELLAARYAVLRAGGRDGLRKLVSPIPWGPWTPGRPYLAGEHAVDPRTGHCHVARVGGAKRGARPGASPHWTRCRRRTHRELLDADQEPLPCAEAGALRPELWLLLRQTRVWWEYSEGAWELPDLPDTKLLDGIDALRKDAAQMFRGELTFHPRTAPCPAIAYVSARGWLADTPLMRALLAERRRRRLPARCPTPRRRSGAPRRR